MAEGFELDRARLDGVSRQLAGCGDRLRAVSRRIAGLGGERRSGSGELDHACAGFAEEWHDGLGRLAHAADQLHAGLERALRGYAEHEDATAQALAAPGFGAHGLGAHGFGGG
ncbi:hypothetical protein [Kitasatospora sp. MAP5-34]|uniref:hypothetical protein n=1 Tax=Kitasatospora sp. MAP5-34 TaxID=3035102 RepID=UPI0024736C3F|nr:hypothetical protein [Kitasatospora sp. MAP5-34]MDH6576584.1 uncharacterized protein YukE [Kitasatospora sp. MAP5-34]